MAKTAKNRTTNTLLLRNLPKDVENLTEILAHLRPLPAEIKPFGRRRALLYYNNMNEASSGLQQLQGLEVENRNIVASLFFKDAVGEKEISDKVKTAAAASQKNKVTKATQTNTNNVAAAAMPALNNYVRKLYACNSNLDFEQPPPPYLRYAYPRITPAILDSICIALMSNTRFYTQVLHLMNRMNLEPPFEPRKQKFVPPGEPCETGTQTDAVVLVSGGEAAQPPLLPRLESSEESELETSADELEKRKSLRELKKRKQLSSETQYKKKARLLLQSSLQQKLLPTKLTATAAASTSQSLHEVFEAPATVKPTRIALNLLKLSKKPAGSIVKKEAPPQTIFAPPSDLSTKRLSIDQLQLLPIYKNYVQGETSPKLYIKNLSKDVCAEDLLALYARFAPPNQLEVKVMQQGRMKGQAFVTFKDLNDSELESVVGVALSETNGFLLKQKPMVVSFGRK